ncbi:MAG: hypothetical protein P8103_17290 [Candidatus Thiodiazotropha sp.]
MDDDSNGLAPSEWSLDGFRKRREAEQKARWTQNSRRSTHTAASLDLPYEIRSALSRYGSHPSEWEPITEENERYNLRAGDQIQLFEKTRKSWVPLKSLNGVRSGRDVLAFRRRISCQRPKFLGDIERALSDQLSYDAVVQQVFFNQDLEAYVEKHGFPSRETMLARLNRRSLKEMSQTLDNVERVESPQHWICLNLCDADGQPATGYPFRLRDSSGAERSGKLDNQGEARVVNLVDGPVEVRFGEPDDEPSITSQRRAIQQALDTVLQAERAEAAEIEAEFQQKSLLGKLTALDDARARGARQAAWGLLTGLKELSDLATQHVNHAITSAWESWRYSDEGHYVEQFAQRFADAEFRELSDVLGFDPRSLTREQWAETLSMANFIWHDAETRQLLIDFAQDYIDAQHVLEVTETASGIATEFAFELAITFLTLGAGATVAVATRARYLNKLKGLGSLFKQLAQRLKQRAGSKQGMGRTGQWHYQTLEKPESRGIEKSVVDEKSASQSTVDSTVMWGDTSVPNTKLSFEEKLILAGDAKRAQIVTEIGKEIGPALAAIRKLDPNARIGFRGSLARGLKGPHKLGQNGERVAFDGTYTQKLNKKTGEYEPYNGAQGYDLDFFVVSDKLASQFGKRDWFRNLTAKNANIRDEFSVLRDRLNNNPDLMGLKKESIDVRVWTTKQIQNKVNNGDPQIYFVQ